MAALAGTLLLAADQLCAQAAPISPPATGLRIEVLPQPLASAPTDLEAIARGYAATPQDSPAPLGLQRGPGLIVFVSLAMPRPTLERLLDQAARAGASVVLRGFAAGSLRRTVTQLQALIGERRIAVQVDPPAFDRFGITRVPSFVLLRDGTRPQPCAAGSCAAPGNFVRVAGDVSLDYALAHMQQAAPAFVPETALFLERLRP